MNKSSFCVVGEVAGVFVGGRFVEGNYFLGKQFEAKIEGRGDC
jgi:hypothetical protein